MNLQQIWILFLFIGCTACDTELLTEHVNAKSIPLHDLKYSSEIADMDNASRAAYYYTYIGQYEKALEEYEQKLSWNFDTLIPKDSLDFLTYQPVEALSYLAERSKSEELVIISEAHQKPSHRVFTREMLTVFYENGFRYLGIEAVPLHYQDSTQFLLDTALHQRGYPLNSPLTGTYSREPQMGNMIREAIDLGFEIFGYDRSMINGDTERDLAQSENIERFMQTHPKEKILIHCGWYHAIESDYPKRTSHNWMAYHLKQRTGIDPLTIYQDVLGEKRAIPESPYYKLVDSDKRSVLVNEEGDTFGGEHFDILLYHPRTRYVRNRPHWLTEIEGNQLVEIEQTNKKGLDYPILAKAYATSETSTATPIDIVELENASSPTALVLPTGSYHIVLTSIDSTEVRYKIEVE